MSEQQGLQKVCEAPGCEKIIEQGRIGIEHRKYCSEKCAMRVARARYREKTKGKYNEYHKARRAAAKERAIAERMEAEAAKQRRINELSELVKCCRATKSCLLPSLTHTAPCEHAIPHQPLPSCTYTSEHVCVRMMYDDKSTWRWVQCMRVDGEQEYRAESALEESKGE